MKKIILILLAILFSSNVTAKHWERNGTQNLDLNKNCSKKRSILKAMPKVIPGGEIVKLNSYTAFSQRFVMNGAYKKNPVQIFGYLILPKGTDKVPIIIHSHGSGGPESFVYNHWIKDLTENLLNLGIGTMMLDNFCSRGAKNTYKDQSKVPAIAATIDTMMAFKFLKSHPRSNGKLGFTGHSRGGLNGLLSVETKITSVFLNNKEGFDAVLAEAAECKMSGLFLKPELTTNTKLLYVHGDADNWTLAKPCEEYVKSIKAKKGQIEIDIKDGWYHDWHAGHKPKRHRRAMVFHRCPEIRMDNEGNVNSEIIDLILGHKIFTSKEEALNASAEDPSGTFKKMFKAFKKEKCIDKGVTIGGKHAEEYMPQALNFFKDNLL